MIALIQRVNSAAVTVDSETVGAIGRGILALIGVQRGDTMASADRLLEAAPEEAKRLFDYFLDRARASHGTVAAGVFGADMQVSLVNDGPVTFWLETPVTTVGD
jgi:D-tyrosyl-tRNA(Tyr) deacylase